jgi:hypothetical protein
MEQKLKALEEKLLHGSNTANEKLCEQAKQLAMREQQIQEKEFLDEERRRKIAELEVSHTKIRLNCLSSNILRRMEMAELRGLQP